MRPSILHYGLIIPLIVGMAWWSQQAPNYAASPEREMRGVWMATVLNIDYPSRPTTSAATLQAEFRSQLGRLKRIGINTIFLQVRPAADALYQSNLAPWSKWLTGQQGVAPSSQFDPLAFAIEEAHHQGIELHAWINPYRVAMDLDSLTLAGNHVFYQHRDWVHIYGNRMYLDPGLPQVQTHLLEIVQELVANYDLDGIHFDDYFYPYPISGQEFPDSLTYRQYGRRFPDRASWRRNNVNELVARIHRSIQATKPWVQFGISPFGVWRNQSDDPRGSATQAQSTSYDGLYGDALRWAADGTVDYLMPQLYWSIGYEPADYELLLDWWTENTAPSTQIYVGQAAYKVGNNHDTRWDELEQIPRQIDLNRRNSRVSGSVFFSAKSLLQSPVEFDQRLADLYLDPVLMPKRLNPSGSAPSPPKLRRVRIKERGPMLVWEVDKEVPDSQLPYYFAIYRSRAGEDLELLDVSPFGQGCRLYHYFDESAEPEVDYEYVVRAMDRWHRQSAPLP
ncbi:MAG: family 10 glycosylhydrolase [Bacteroidota bacterium]